MSQERRWMGQMVWRWLGGAALVLATIAGFLAYLRPDFIVDLAGRMFLCS